MLAEFYFDSDGRRTRANQPDYDKSNDDTANAHAGKRGGEALVGEGRGHTVRLLFSRTTLPSSVLRCETLFARGVFRPFRRAGRPNSQLFECAPPPRLDFVPKSLLPKQAESAIFIFAAIGPLVGATSMCTMEKQARSRETRERSQVLRPRNPVGRGSRPTWAGACTRMPVKD